MSPILREVGEYLDLSHRLRWDRAESPDGLPWKPLKAETVQRKIRKGRNRGILVESGNLRDLLRYQVSGEALYFGTGLVYGATHQFGRPEAGIPARPWLGISDDDEIAIEGIVYRHLADVTGG